MSEELTPGQQLAFMRELVDMYLDNMEGTDQEECAYWQRLYDAAMTIVDAMEGEVSLRQLKEKEK